MQTDIIISDILTKDADPPKKWKLTKWTDQNGVKYSTFEPSARSIPKGSLVRIQYVGGEKGNDIDEGGIEVLEQATPLQSASTPPPVGAISDEDTRHSIENQSSAATILTYTAAMKANGMDLSLEELEGHRNAFAWLSSHFGPPTVIAIGDTHISATEDTRPLPPITQADEDIDQLKSAAPNGLDIAWALESAGRLGWSKPLTLHSWFNQPVNAFASLYSLVHLTFGCEFNQPVDENLRKLTQVIK